VAGVNWQIQIVALKALDDLGNGNNADLIAAIDYAANTNLHIRLTSNSWGGGPPSIAMRNAIQRAGNNGQLFICAAGNDTLDIDFIPVNPASLNLSNQITVASISPFGTLSRFSNYGVTNVHLAAPGELILSTFNFNDFQPATYGTRSSQVFGSTPA